jgi:hypothetical protein
VSDCVHREFKDDNRTEYGESAAMYYEEPAFHELLLQSEHRYVRERVQWWLRRAAQCQTTVLLEPAWA